MTMTLVSTVTVGAGGAASIDFTGIPQTATDLFLVVSARATTSGPWDFLVRMNDVTTGYTHRRLIGTGSIAQSTGGTDSTLVLGYRSIIGSEATANTFSNCEVYFPNYAGSAAKSVSANQVGENNATEAYQTISAGLTNDTAAITSIKIYTSTNLAQYSTASLYLIEKGSGGATVS